MNFEQSKAGMTAARGAWVRKRVQEVMRRRMPSHKMGASHRTTQDRIEAVTSAYRDLWILGYRIEKVEALATRHLTALLASWKTKGLSRETVRIRWVHLTVWCIVLGKAGMAPAFKEVWPKEPATERPTSMERGVDRLTPEQYAQLLEKLEHKTDQTGYWLVRCVKELGLTREEAVLFEPRVLRDLTGTVDVWSSKGRRRRSVILLDPDKRDLVIQVHKFMKSRGRERLGWREQSVAQMVKRYANLVSYAMAQLGGTYELQGGQV